MNGMRTLGTWALAPLRQMESSSFRILGATRSASMRSAIHCELVADRRQRGASFIKPQATHRFYSHSAEAEFGKRGRSFWSAIAAGLLGLGGISLVFDNSNGGLFRPLLPKVFCACGCDDKPKDDCGCKKDDCIEKKCESSECLRKTDCEEEIIQKANQELEKALRDTKCKAVDFTEQALKAYCDAIAAIKEFMNKVYCAVEDETIESPRFEEVWEDVYKALKRRCELAKIAMEKGACAWELLKRLRQLIEDGKACKYTQCHPLLVTAEECLLCAEKEICCKKTEMETLLKESRPVEQYRNLVEEFRRDLKAEADSLVPSESCRVTLNDNEANMVLTHAYKKILRIQKELASGGDEC